MRISRSYGLMAFALTGLLAFGSSITQAQPTAPAFAAQAASPNADLLTLLRAGATEKVVLAKIHDGAGHWDTTPDALAELRKAGATEAEIKALSDATTLAPGATRATVAPHPGLQAGISATGNQAATSPAAAQPMGQTSQSHNQTRATATPGAGVPTGIAAVPTGSRSTRATATANVSATNKPSAPVAAPAPAASDKILCPASGFVPGVKRAVAAGTWAPVACTAGAAIYVAGQPQFDTACTNTTAGGNGKGPTCPTPSSSADTSATPASDGVPVSGPGSQVAGVASCIKTSSNDDGTINFQNTCPTKVVYTWAPQTPGAGDPLSEDGTLDPGETRKSSTAPAGGGGYGYYACPAGYVPQDPQKQAVSQYVTGYACVKQ